MITVSPLLYLYTSIVLKNTLIRELTDISFPAHTIFYLMSQVSHMSQAVFFLFYCLFTSKHLHVIRSNGFLLVEHFV